MMFGDLAKLGSMMKGCYATCIFDENFVRCWVENYNYQKNIFAMELKSD